jgi:hypothetical protein
LDFLPTDGRGCQLMGHGLMSNGEFRLAPESRKPVVKEAP